MRVRVPVYTPAFLILGLAGVTACGDSPAPTSPSAAAGLGASLTAEPLSARPEFLPGFSCPGRPAFGVGLTVIVAARNYDVILQRLRFTFSDPRGGRALPEVFPTSMPTPSSSIPSTSPIPMPGAIGLPTTPPVGVPGSPPIQDLPILRGASRSLPFFLRFGCDVVPEGTLVVTADTRDSSHTLRTAEIRVPVNRF